MLETKFRSFKEYGRKNAFEAFEIISSSVPAEELPILDAELVTQVSLTSENAGIVATAVIYEIEASTEVPEPKIVESLVDQLPDNYLGK